MVIEILILLVVSILIFSIAPYCNAVMDSCDHHYIWTVFYAPGNTTKKRFGIEWNMWHGIDQMWKNKYVDRDPQKGLRKTKILFWRIHIVQLYDAWHWYKMWMIVAFCVAISVDFVAASVWITMANVSVMRVIIGLLSVFFIHGIMWNVVFNLFYDKLLRKSEYRV